MSLTAGPASRRFRLHRCERLRLRQTARTATDGASALSAGAADNALHSFRFRAGYGPVWNASHQNDEVRLQVRLGILPAQLIEAYRQLEEAGSFEEQYEFGMEQLKRVLGY